MLWDHPVPLAVRAVLVESEILGTLVWQGQLVRLVLMAQQDCKGTQVRLAIPELVACQVVLAAQDNRGHLECQALVAHLVSWAHLVYQAQLDQPESQVLRDLQEAVGLVECQATLDILVR